MVPLLFSMATVTAEAAVWLEAEQFDSPGGWVNDPQFVDLMGSPYLLANGNGRPVEDAVTAVRLPEPGVYRLWVRCKDWLPEHSPGAFQVFVDGKPSPVTFGVASTDAWQWVHGGELDLRQGDVEVRLHDLTGWWGRCDALVLTAGPEPSNDPNTLAAQRERYGGVSAKRLRHGPYDFVVVGGGLAGCAAAISAARHGCMVALIQDRPVLGGNASSEIRVWPSGDTSDEPLDPRETGIIEELAAIPSGADRSQHFESIVRAEDCVELFLNTRATGVGMRRKGRIGSVRALNVLTGERHEFRGRLFADCTGDGWVGFWAGADFRTGREGRDDFAEPAAPPVADSHSLSTSLTGSTVVTRDEPVAFEAPAWAPKWESCADFDAGPKATQHSLLDQAPVGFHTLEPGRGRHPESANPLNAWWLEVGGMQDTIYDAESIRDQLFGIKLGLWDHVKNHCPQFAEENRNREFVWTNHIAGKRESRRLLGDYVLTQRDYADRVVHEDTVAYAGYNVDPHHPQGFWTKGPQAFRLYHYKASVPYRILYSRNIENLFMAGRNVSATHLALNGIRVMRITAMMGQVVGTAAGIAHAHGTMPRGVYEHYLAELQQTLLRDGCYLMGVPNQDPEDLALSAEVTASSQAVIADPRQSAEPPHGGTLHAMDSNRAVMFTPDHDAIDSIALHLKSDRQDAAAVTATLCRAAKLGDFSQSVTVATTQASVPPGADGWIEFPFQAEVQPGRPHYVWLPATEGLSWHLYPREVPGTARAYGGPDWHPMTHCYKFRLSPGGEPASASAAAAEVVLAAANATDGWNRAVHGEPHSWSPEPEAPPPHWIELRLHEPRQISVVHVTFQLREMAARSYWIGVPEGDGWQTVIRVEDNRSRRRVHKLDAVECDRVRLFIDEPSIARICEIRVYP
jgi:hypothetical protein